MTTLAQLPPDLIEIPHPWTRVPAKYWNYCLTWTD